MSRPNLNLRGNEVPKNFRRFYSGVFCPKNGEPFTLEWHKAELKKVRAELWLIQEGHYWGSPRAKERQGTRGRDPSMRDQAMEVSHELIAWHLWALEEEVD